ncbi:unnamed protein product [Cuscuta campestris]|uniref:DUF4408 domain-containing protein n=1 Tax=Cuscuta campestris TaxID=132261 RepID=A0A484LP06_9ASTE|nr:unnamed protein product [Cuscuta campestris]
MQERERSHKFLMGLNDARYVVLRSNPLAHEPVPYVGRMYNILVYGETSDEGGLSSSTSIDYFENDEEMPVEEQLDHSTRNGRSEKSGEAGMLQAVDLVDHPDVHSRPREQKLQLSSSSSSNDVYTDLYTAPNVRKIDRAGFVVHSIVTMEKDEVMAAEGRSNSDGAMMRALFQCQGQKTLQTAILAVEILLLPPGLVSTFLMLRRAAAHLRLLLPGGEHWARRVRLSPSPPPLFMCVFVNSIVILILLTSSKLHRRRRKNDSLFDLFSYDAGDPAAVGLPSGTVSSPPAAALTVTLDYQDHNDNNGRSLLRDDEDHITKENLNEPCRDTIEATWAAIHCGGGGDNKFKKSGTWPKPPPQPQTAEHDTFNALPPSVAAAAAKSPTSVVPATKSPSPMAVAKNSPQPSVAAVGVKSPPSVVTATAKSLPSVATAMAKSLPSVAAAGVKSPPYVAAATAKSLPSVVAAAKSPTSVAARKEKELRKSTTFTDAVPATSRRGGDGGGVRGPEELDKRFEEFIRNFNHELRLERQDSEERFWERIKRGLN